MDDDTVGSDDTYVHVEKEEEEEERLCRGSLISVMHSTYSYRVYNILYETPNGVISRPCVELCRARQSFLRYYFSGVKITNSLRRLV